MKILLVSVSFYPMVTPRSFRTTELVKELCRQGHEVSLVTDYHPAQHDALAQEYSFKIIDLGGRSWPSVPPSDHPLWHMPSRIARRVLSLFFEYPDMEIAHRVRNQLKKLSGFDLMISIAVPHMVHFGVALARSKQHPIAKTWVADNGDPYTGANLDSFRKPFYFKYVERYFFGKCDFMTVPIEDAKAGYEPRFHSKIRVIPQGFDLKPFAHLPTKYMGKSAAPRFAFAGSFIQNGRDPRKMLEYLLSLEQDYHFSIYTRNPELAAWAVAPSLGRISVHPFIPRDQLLEQLAEMDFLVNIQNESALMSPSKLIDYALTGRPVLSLSGQSADFSALDRFMAGDYREDAGLKNVADYDIAHIVRQFIRLHHG